VLAAGCAKSPEEQELRKSGDKVSIVLEGIIEPSQEAKIVTQLSGRLKTVSVKDGSRVKRGQMLAAFYSEELRQNYRKAQLEYERAVLHRSLEREFTQPSKESLANARERMLSTFELYHRDQASLAEVKGAEDAYLSLQHTQQDWANAKSYEARQASLSRAEAAKDAQRARVDVETARENYVKSRILAPMDGYVTNLKAFGEQNVSQGEVLGSIMNIDQVNLKGSFSPGIYPYLKKGMQVDVSCFTTPPYQTKGTILDIVPVVDSETKRMRLDIPIANKKYLLQPGDKCVINFEVKQKEAAAAGLPPDEKKVIIRSDIK
jgi:multidrug efflux pump subunit AcrA (membrane-fusion protein)